MKTKVNKFISSKIDNLMFFVYCRFSGNNRCGKTYQQSGILWEKVVKVIYL